MLDCDRATVIGGEASAKREPGKRVSDRNETDAQLLLIPATATAATLRGLRPDYARQNIPGPIDPKEVTPVSAARGLGAAIG